MRHPARALIISALAVGLMATGCNKNSGGNPTPSSSGIAQTAIVVDYKGTTPTPAPAVPGAKTGGKLTILQDGDFEHLSPQMIYVSNALEYSQLFHRMLTQYIEDPNGGPLKLVGDLATNAGETTDGKVWTYHLRDGIKFEDGSAITSKDVAFGIALAFSDFGVQGPQYLQNDLDPSHAYKGPLNGGAALPPGVTTPDDKTIVFTFNEAHTELPYLLEFPTSTPVPQAKFNNEKYETSFVSTGPYKIKEYKKDVSLTLEKNPNWDPNTDPIRHQYLDSVVFDFTTDAETQTNRLEAASGDDAAAFMTGNVPATKIAEVKGNPDALARTVSAPTPFERYIYINTARVTDVDVRRALNLAFDPDAYIKAVGGYDVAEPATTLLAKVVPGWKNYNAYPSLAGTKNGDPDKAKTLLTGKTVSKLKYCFPNTPSNQTVAAVVSTALGRGGFTFTLSPVDPAGYYTTVGVKGTDCDIIAGGWGQDWPDGEATLGVLFDGTRITDRGNNNLSYFNEASVNSKLAELRALTDRGQAAAQYGDLDQKIMTDFAPVIPLRYDRFFSMKGPKLGGTFASPLFAEFNITGIFING